VGGPTEQKTDTVFIPPGEGRQTFAPSPLAWLVENLVPGQDGILESVVGPAPLRIKRSIYVTDDTVNDKFENLEVDPVADGGGIEGIKNAFADFSFKSGVPFSIFAARVMRNKVSILLYRIGSRLYLFRGGSNNADEVLISDLTVNPESKTLDHYAVIHDRIIYSNGVDRPKVITYDGNVQDLGFSRAAAAPAVSCPSQPDYDEAPNYYPNSMAYSWQGRIGTPGDELSGQKASLLKGMWYYYFQYEDLFGNLSEFSNPSEPATIHTNQADPFFTLGVKNISEDKQNLTVGGEERSKRGLPMGTEIDDLTRRFLVKAVGDLPSHAVATRIYRTPDTVHKESTPRLLARVPGSRQFYFDDNHADSDLGAEWVETVSVPLFNVCCAHQGRLIIGNLPGDSGIIRRSQVGFPGTFEKFDFVYPDSNGNAITALHSHNGNLVAFTETSTYLLGDDFSVPRPVSTTVGCVSPKSIQSFRDGSLMWLAQDGIYSLRPDGALIKLSTPIDKIFDQELNWSQFFRASSIIDFETGEYRCAIAAKGESRNTIMLCFDGTYWRRQTLGIQIADMCRSPDHTNTTFMLGSDQRETDVTIAHNVFVSAAGGDTPVRTKSTLSRVFVANRQSPDYFAPPRRIRYRSAWLRSSELGLIPTNVRRMYIGLLDSWVGNATIRLYRNGCWEPISELSDVRLCGPDDGSGIVLDSAENAVLGEAKAREPRLFWRQIPVDIQNANCWAFEIDIVGSVDPDFPEDLKESLNIVRGTASEPDVFDRSGSLASTRLDVKAFDRLFDVDQAGSTKFIESAIDDPTKWELGRLRIAAFAFDTSIATKGSPTGRVPKRQDK
jgi:hypothetical protein